MSSIGPIFCYWPLSGECIPFAQNAYNSVSWNMTPRSVITDKPRNTATRAPGTTQGHAIIGKLANF